MKNVDQINRSWTEFNIGFWIIFVMKLVSKSSLEITAYPVMVFVQIIPVIMMVILIGYYSYKFSGKKLFWLNGLLGLFWFLTIGILIAYFAVRRIKDYELKKLAVANNEGTVENIKNTTTLIIVTSIGVIVLGFVIWGAIVGLNDSSKNNNGAMPTVNTPNEKWEKVTSPNGSFSINLPRNPIFQEIGSANNIKGFSYLATLQDGNIVYAVKYEDYQSISWDTGIDLKKATTADTQEFLTALLNSYIKELGITNSSSKFVMNHGLESLRFSGIDEEKSLIEGVIISNGNEVIYILGVARLGYLLDFDRVLNSLEIITI